MTALLIIGILIAIVIGYCVTGPMAIGNKRFHMFKFKTIQPNGTSSFIKRFAFYFQDMSSIKIHLILTDDLDEPHTHPWDFKSLLIIPYKEKIYDYQVNNRAWSSDNLPVYNLVQTRINLFPMFAINRAEANTRHKVELYRIFGIKIPALTIGYYGKKKQLCSFCQTLGYCKENPPKSI